MTANETKVFHVGIITGSNRTPARAGPQITKFVQDTIAAHQGAAEASDAGHTKIQLHLIDVAQLNLPFFNEPLYPALVTATSQYTHELTRAWSTTATGLDAFVFVTPQYNWGIPAGLKNAVDFLWHEWKGKPAMIVSYGGHGGTKAAEALALVLRGGVKMSVVEQPVTLQFPGRDFLVKCNGGEDLGLDAKSETGTWADRKEAIVAAWEEMLKMLGTNVTEQ